MIKEQAFRWEVMKLPGDKGASFRWEVMKLPGDKGASFPVGSDEATR